MFTPLISGLSFYDMLAYFVIFSIVGYMLEVMYAAVVLGKFVNRGFLNGPWCPIYGFGMVIVGMILKPVSGGLITLFIGSVILTSVLEFVTGFVLEKVFGLKWWDYTDEPYNLGGYICLRFSLIWGAACVFVVKLILPFTDWLIAVIPKTFALTALFAVILLMLSDLIVTIITIVGIKKKIRVLSGIAAKLRENSNSMGEFISSETIELRQKFDELSASLTEKHDSSRLFDAFPSLKRSQIDEKVAELRDSFAGVRENLAGMRDNIAEMRDNIEAALDRTGKRVEQLRPKTGWGDVVRYAIVLLIGLAIGFAAGRFLQF